MTRWILICVCALGVAFGSLWATGAVFSWDDPDSTSGTAQAAVIPTPRISTAVSLPAVAMRIQDLAPLATSSLSVGPLARLIPRSAFPNTSGHWDTLTGRAAHRHAIGRATAQVAELLDGLPAFTPARPFGTLQGDLPAPVQGPVYYRFGPTGRQRSATSVRHNGVTFGCAPGSRVTAVGFGQVTFAGEIDGMGAAAVIAHGGGYHTVYAPLARLDVYEGDIVQPGQLLGTTDPRDGNRVFFQVRVNTRPVDPQTWLR
ncbi:MAG: peptidoglycan DD-metalloendopeptidase family protein [Myxococcales bacterium]|nr:peptidoglycan DD-metalloendopeptidase family protein [Myxococcales bacterium]